MIKKFHMFNENVNDDVWIKCPPNYEFEDGEEVKMSPESVYQNQCGGDKTGHIIKNYYKHDSWLVNWKEGTTGCIYWRKDLLIKPRSQEEIERIRKRKEEIRLKYMEIDPFGEEDWLEESINSDIDPYGEENWEDKPIIEYDYEKFCDLADSNILDKLHSEYLRYSDPDQNLEDFYYANIKYWSKRLSQNENVHSDIDPYEEEDWEDKKRGTTYGDIMKAIDIWAQMWKDGQTHFREHYIPTIIKQYEDKLVKSMWDDMHIKYERNYEDLYDL